jgi:hypothetical protein
MAIAYSSALHPEVQQENKRTDLHPGTAIPVDGQK